MVPLLNCKSKLTRNFSSFILVLGIVILLLSCSKHESPKPSDEKYTFNARLVSLINAKSPAMAVIQGTYSKEKKTLNYSIHFKNIIPENITLNEGKAIGPANLLANLKGNKREYTNPATGIILLNSITEKILFDQQMYINIFTLKYPSGELQGKLNLIKN